MQLIRLNCCGIVELDGLTGKPEELVDHVSASYYHGHKYRYVLFSDRTSRGRHRKLANYITKNKLGEVIPVPPAVNTNTGNRIQPMMWVVNWVAMRSWAARHHETISSNLTDVYDEKYDQIDFFEL